MRTTIGKTIVGGIVASISPAISRDDQQTLRYAALNYGFLLQRGETLQPLGFAARIRRTYAPSTQRDAVLATLERAAALDEPVCAEDDAADAPRMRA